MAALSIAAVIAAQYGIQAARPGASFITLSNGDVFAGDEKQYKRWRYGWPRSDEKRIARMNRYVEWKREKIRERRWLRFWWALGLLCGPSIFITTVSLVWRVCAWVVAF